MVGILAVGMCSLIFTFPKQSKKTNEFLFKFWTRHPQTHFLERQPLLTVDKFIDLFST